MAHGSQRDTTVEELKEQIRTLAALTLKLSEAIAGNPAMGHDGLVKKQEDMEKRVYSLETWFQRGYGAAIILYGGWEAFKVYRHMS